MKRPAKDEKREERIQMEIIVDAYGPEEQITGWLCYLEEHLHVPFAARCVARHTTSPLQIGEEVEVIGMPPEEDGEPNMRVMIRWQGHEFAVLLQQLEGIQVDEETQQAIEDWHYWVEQAHCATSNHTHWEEKGHEKRLMGEDDPWRNQGTGWVG